MSLVIPQTEKESAHYYLASGEPCHGTLREARKVGAFPSVTTILQAAAKPGLEKWKMDATLTSALSLPRRQGEDLQEFAKRVQADADEQKKMAAVFGTAVHALAEAILSDEAWSQDAIYMPFAEKLMEWKSDKITQVHQQEFAIVNEEDGYAGRCDAVLTHKDYGVCIVDFKTRGRPLAKPLKTVGKVALKPPIPARKNGDLLQLAAYRHGFFDGLEAQTVTCLSVLIDNRTGEIEEKAWENVDACQAYEAFCALTDFWCWDKGYDPRKAS